MKKLIKIMAVTVLMASSVGAATLEETNQFISEAKNPVFKQMLICEREVLFNLKNQNECIKAAEMNVALRKKITKDSLLRCEIYSLNKYECLLAAPDIYKMTDNEYFNNTIANMYSSAGSIYNKIEDNANEVEMYKKALEFSPNHSIGNFNLGLSYYLGNGIEANKIKAYEHWRVAAKQGNQGAQKRLDILCSDSPWACK